MEKETKGLPLAQELKRRLNRRDFLKLTGAGFAGTAMLGTAGCGVFQSDTGGGQGNGGGGTGGGGEGGGGGKSFSYNLNDTIKDLNSTTTTDSVSTDILKNIMEGLYVLDENQEPQPSMAEGVEVSDDGLNYTFTLREGVKWSDGSPVTAQDFEFAWLRALDPETADQYAFIIGQFVKGGTEFNAGEGSREDVGIKATDEKTLEVTLAAPAPFFLGLTSFFTYLPQKQEFTEQQGDKYAQSAEALLYNGPYKLTEFNPTRGVTLVKNDQYWDADNVDVEQVEMKIVKEVDTAVNLFESGELDITEISQEYVDEYEGQPEFQQSTQFATFYMVFNYENEVFQNENIRKAFQIGYDREALAVEILNDGSTAADGYVPPGIAGPEGETFRDAQGAVQPKFNAGEAKSLFETGIEELGDNPEIELLAYDTDSGKAVATFLQSQFQDNFGAKIKVKTQPFDAKLQLEEDGKFQLSWQGWFADYDDPMTYLDLWLSDASFNTQGFKDEQYDKLIRDAQKEPDAAARMDLLLEAERLLVQELGACAPMFHEGRTRLIKTNIKNFTYQPYGGGLALKPMSIEG